jgi:YVTN family beta-propeller protein
VTPDGKYIYVSNQGGNGVAVIETASNTVAQTILVGTGPSGIVVTPDGKYVSHGRMQTGILRDRYSTMKGAPTDPKPDLSQTVDPNLMR